MNHDYAHCLDFKKNCPKSCFRAELTREVKRRADLQGIPMTWTHFKGTDECEKGERMAERTEMVLKALWDLQRRARSKHVIETIGNAIEEIETLESEVWELRNRVEEYEREYREYEESDD